MPCDSSARGVALATRSSEAHNAKNFACPFRFRNLEVEFSKRANHKQCNNKDTIGARMWPKKLM